LSQWDNGIAEATRHNALIAHAIDADLFDQNKQYVEEIIRKSAERNVKVMLINVPLYNSYRENQNSLFLKQQKDFCKYFAERHKNVLYYDFSGDLRFTEDDFYDANHLNDKGTKKFSLLLDSIMVRHSSYNLSGSH